MFLQKVYNTNGVMLIFLFCVAYTLMIKGEFTILQVCVTQKVKRKISSAQIKSAICVILFFLILGTILISLIVSRKKENLFYGQNLYLVYTSKTKNVSSLENEKDMVKNLGGAGVVFLFKKEYYLICNVYLKKDEAEEIKKGIAENYNNAGILEISAKKVKNIKHFKQNEDSKNMLKFIKNNLFELAQTEIDFISGNISEGKLGAWALSKKQELEQLISKNIETNDEIVRNLCSYAKLIVLQYDNFLNQFYIKSNKQSLFCEFVVNFSLIFADMWNYLWNYRYFLYIFIWILLELCYY